MNVSLLVYFKYSNFFVDNINTLFGLFGVSQFAPIAKIALPIGISFYTFESITYSVDVYRGQHKPLNNFFDYLLYILFFPKLIAGPIIRYHEIEGQLTNRFDTDNINSKINGLFRFFVGLSKKVLIANVLAEQADKIFALPISDLDTLTAWSGALLYTFQIYFDFSGYSDMAIGLALVFGFKLTENFNNPYISKSITEFWRRWHISLGNWMKNYLYIPLGGNKVKSRSRLFFNLWLVFVCSGFWHGANWTFIVWGVFHGSLLIMDKLFYLKFSQKIPSFISVAVTFIFVIIGWVVFRSATISQAATYLYTMFSFKNNGNFIYYFEPKVLFTLSYAVLFSFMWYAGEMQNLQKRILFNDPGTTGTVIKTIAGALFFIICLGALVSDNFNPFIYFRF
ncbi:MAG: MBOAT family protein [Bacteroidia bacterium]|nr:MBOAT family protein [Bacteroidia bacterium]